MRYQRSFPWCLSAALFILMLGCGSSSNDPLSNESGTQSGSEIRLRARGEAVINGVEAELRGTFERRSDRTRLDGELEDINLPIDSAISFCLVQRGNTPSASSTWRFSAGKPSFTLAPMMVRIPRTYRWAMCCRRATARVATPLIARGHC